MSPWQTKPTDRFVLKWIKCQLSARITPRLVHLPWLRPWMITVSSACLGVCGGLIFALGLGWLAAVFAAASQVLDGVDGQFARLTSRQSAAGAFLDSVLDRFAGGALTIGLIIYLVRLPGPIPHWPIVALGSLALIGSSQVSYTTARAANLGLQLGKPTLASKGTRMTVIVLCAVGAIWWQPMPIVALCYLVVHPNAVVIGRLVRAFRSSALDVRGRD